MICLPHFRTTLRQIKNLSRIEQPLKFLQQLCTLITARFRIYENQDRLHRGRWYGFNDPQGPLRFLLLFFLSVFLLFPPIGRCVIIARSFFSWRFLQAAFEGAFSRKLHDPRRWYYDRRVSAKPALLAYLFNIETRLLVVMSDFAPATVHRYDLLGTEA